MRKSILREEKEYIQITSIDEIDFTHPEIVASLAKAYATLLRNWSKADEQGKNNTHLLPQEEREAEGEK